MIVVFTGPESTAKSSLAELCADKLNVPLIKEAARDFLNGRAHYCPTDLLTIVHLHRTAEQRLIDSRGQALVFADTDLQNIYLWWQEKYGPAPLELVDAYRSQSERCYLLCKPDIAWAADELRENPLDRNRLFDLYQADLEARGANYAVVAGTGEIRAQAALDGIKKLTAHLFA